MIKQVAIVAAALLLLTSLGLAQNEGRWDVALNASALIGKQTSGNGTVQIPTTNLGFLGTARFRFQKKSSLEVNWGHADDSQKYVTSALQYRIPTTISEFSGAFVFTPMETKRFKPFLLIGGGALVFNPNNTLIGGNPQALEGVRQTRPTVLYGGGVDYHLISIFALRLQYRGLFYSPPDFRLPGLFTGGQGHMAEPTVGIMARF
jgi:opacity protein-like surface antigen